MYKKGAGDDKQGKDAGNRTLCPYRNFSQEIICFAFVHRSVWEHKPSFGNFRQETGFLLSILAIFYHFPSENEPGTPLQ